MDYLADKGIIKPDLKSKSGCNNRLVSITKLFKDNYSLLFLNFKPRRVYKVVEDVCKLGDFLLSPVIDDNLVLGMVKDLLL
jgi:ribosomal protein L10